MQRLFIQRRRVVAVPIPIVYSADTAPDYALAAVAVAPCAALVSCAALTAVQSIRQRMQCAYWSCGIGNGIVATPYSGWLGLPSTA